MTTEAELLELLEEDEDAGELVFSEAHRTTPTTLAEHVTAGRYLPSAHLELVSEVMMRAATEGGVRAVINMPPRHGKTWTVRHGLAWALDVEPTHKIIYASYSLDLARAASEEVRDILRGQDLTAKLKRGVETVDEWATEQGGRFVAAGIKGSITGKGASILVIDDPFKDRADADSDNSRKRVWDAYTSTLRTRLEQLPPTEDRDAIPPSIIVIQTRWHHDDLTGRLMKQQRDFERGLVEADDFDGPWEVIELKAIAANDETDPLGREPGEPLAPALGFDLAELRKIRGALGGAKSRDWSALYQQQPTADGASFFPPISRWARYRERPPIDHALTIFGSIDTNLASGADYFSGQIWGAKRGRGKDPVTRLYYLDEVYTNEGWRRSLALLKAKLDEYPRARAIVVEQKALGPTLIDELRAEGLAQRVVAFEPRGSKEARAQSVVRFVEEGLLVLPADELSETVVDFGEELERFPLAPHDDRVDALVQLAICAFIRKVLPMGNRGPIVDDDALAGRSKMAI